MQYVATIIDGVIYTYVLDLLCYCSVHILLRYLCTRPAMLLLSTYTPEALSTYALDTLSTYTLETLSTYAIETPWICSIIMV